MEDILLQDPPIPTPEQERAENAYWAKVAREQELEERSKLLDKVRDFMVSALERSKNPSLPDSQLLAEILDEISDLHREIEPEHYSDGSELKDDRLLPNL